MSDGNCKHWSAETAPECVTCMAGLRAQLQAAQELAERTHAAYRGLYALWLRVARAMTPAGGPDITDEEVAENAEHVAAKVAALEARHTDETLRQKAADLQTSKVRGFEKRDARIAALEADLRAERERSEKAERFVEAWRRDYLNEREKTARLEKDLHWWSGGASGTDIRARIEAETLERAAKELESHCVLRKPWPGGHMPYHDSCPDCRAARIVRALAASEATDE